MSTLNYAQRAVGIQNKPVSSVRMTRRLNMAEGDGEIGRLMGELDGARGANGMVEQTAFRELELRLQVCRLRTHGAM